MTLWSPTRLIYISLRIYCTCICVWCMQGGGSVLYLAAFHGLGVLLDKGTDIDVRTYNRKCSNTVHLIHSMLRWELILTDQSTIIYSHIHSFIHSFIHILAYIQYILMRTYLPTHLHSFIHKYKRMQKYKHIMHAYPQTATYTFTYPHTIYASHLPTYLCIHAFLYSHVQYISIQYT